MKKNLAAIIACTMLLAACSSDEPEETTAQTTLPETTAQETEATEETTVETTEETTEETIEETIEETEIPEETTEETGDDPGEIVYVNCDYDDYVLPDYIPSEGSVYVSVVDVGYNLTKTIQKEYPNFESDSPIYWVEILVVDWDNGTAQEYFDADLFRESAYDYYYYDNLEQLYEVGGYTLADGALELGMTEEEYRVYMSDYSADSYYSAFWHDVIDSTSIEVNENDVTFHWNGNMMGIYMYDGDDLYVELHNPSLIYPEGVTHRLFELYE